MDPGNIVHAADTNGLLVITQMEPIAVIFTLPEDNLPAVDEPTCARGQLPVKAMTRDLSSELATGMLQTIDNQIDQTTGTVRLKAVFDNKDRALWPNQFVNARLLLDTQKDAIVIPAAAIQNGSQGTFVYVVKQDKTVEVRPVTVGSTEGNIASISERPYCRRAGGDGRARSAAGWRHAWMRTRMRGPAQRGGPKRLQGGLPARRRPAARLEDRQRAGRRASGAPHGSASRMAAKRQDRQDGPRGQWRRSQEVPKTRVRKP